MAQILPSVIGGVGTMAFWYHFAILFEALFIRTAVGAGIRAWRFMLQDLLVDNFVPALKRVESLHANLIAADLYVAAWGCLLYQGVIACWAVSTPCGRCSGCPNQMLAAVARLLGTVVMFRMKRERFAWVTLAPAAWLLVCALTAGWQKIFSTDPKVGLHAHTSCYADALAQGSLLAPARRPRRCKASSSTTGSTRPGARSSGGVVISLLIYCVEAVLAARAANRPTARETPFVSLPGGARLGLTTALRVGDPPPLLLPSPLATPVSVTARLPGGAALNPTHKE